MACPGLFLVLLFALFQTRKYYNKSTEFKKNEKKIMEFKIACCLFVSLNHAIRLQNQFLKK